MHIVESTSVELDSVQAAHQVVAAVHKQLGGATVDIAFVFISHQHAPELEEAFAALAAGLKARHLVGCTAESIIGGKLEHEGHAAITLWAASMPKARLETSHITLEQTADGFAFLGIPEIPEGPATMILLPEPFSFPTDEFLKRLREDHPALEVLGGMASAARSPGENRLFCGTELLVDGAVCMLLSGGARVRPLVSQGCRPFGKSFVVTRAEKNLIRELGGKPALEKLSAELKELSPDERAMLDRGLHVGLAIDASKREHKRGDFLVRNVLGASREDGSVVVADMVRPGTTIQFHLRDVETASEDLELLLRAASSAAAPPRGALLFSCNGRGTRMFEVPNHDTSCVARELGELPLAGFFAAGEIGPVGGENFLHGFTASIALFEEVE